MTFQQALDGVTRVKESKDYDWFTVAASVLLVALVARVARVERALQGSPYDPTGR